MSPPAGSSFPELRWGVASWPSLNEFERSPGKGKFTGPRVAPGKTQEAD